VHAVLTQHVGMSLVAHIGYLARALSTELHRDQALWYKTCEVFKVSQADMSSLPSGTYFGLQRGLRMDDVGTLRVYAG
jgi:hypothetical protein